MSWPVTWTTRNELDFIDQLGNHQSAEDRRALLLGYRQGLLLRTVWIGIDRKRVLAHVDSLLNPAVNPNPTQGDQS